MRLFLSLQSEIIAVSVFCVCDVCIHSGRRDGGTDNRDYMGGGVSGLGKWKLGGKIMWKVEIRG